MKNYTSLRDHVYSYIKEQVFEGNLLPSERINETLISQELSVSRTPVREALIQLSCEGVLENIPRKGFTLNAVSEEEASQLYAVIGLLDGMAAKTACDGLTEKEINRMEFYVQSMDLAINTDNYEMYLEQQELFHLVYINKCHNEVLADTISRLKSKFFTRGYSKDNKTQNKKLLSEINSEHREILSLFKEKDKEGLFNYMIEVHWAPIHSFHEIIK